MGTHQDVDGIDKSMHIPLWTAKGHGGLFTMGERDYFTDAEKKLKGGKVQKALKDGLKKQGINSI
jgi:hypothetical protein